MSEPVLDRGPTAAAGPSAPRLRRTGLTRPDEIERALACALDLSRRDLMASFSPDGGRWPPEVLAHLVRRAAREGDRPVLDAGAAALVGRCQPFLRSSFRGFGTDDRVELQADVIVWLVERLVLDDEGADFAEVRFWSFLRYRVLTTARRELDRRARVDHGTWDPALLDGALADTAMGAEDLAAVEQALRLLPPDLRRVYVLHHRFGWRVGSDDLAREDPDDPSLATLIGISARAVRKRLARADSLLEVYRHGPL